MSLRKNNGGHIFLIPLRGRKRLQVRSQGDTVAGITRKNKSIGDLLDMQRG
jgi:hypothetical protein